VPTPRCLPRRSRRPPLPLALPAYTGVSKSNQA
jgi:hypothetical protein